jgi:hypothetical protein
VGCDIHLWVEVRRADRWEFAHPRLDKTDETFWFREFWQPFIERNYYLFGILANVRNHENVVQPISKPRGKPVDISEIGLKLLTDMGSDGHSHSWYSATELTGHDWSREVQLPSGYYRPSPPKDCYQECELCKQFVEEFLPTLASYGDPVVVRVVFFFDN